MDLEKILPLILIALWYIFKGGKKKDKKSVAERIQEFEQKVAPNDSAQSTPQATKKPSSLQDILEELIGEPKAQPKVELEVEAEQPASRKRFVHTPSDHSVTSDKKDSIFDNYDRDRAAAKASELISRYDEENREEKMEESDFDLRQAIIHQAILERPYID